jgi:hypothetical protein
MSPQTKRDIESLFVKLFFYLKTNLGLKSTPKLVLREDIQNAKHILGKTGYYDPKEQKIVLFTTERHPKDILRSFAHEVVHHWQNEKGELESQNESAAGDPEYAQHDPQLRKMEKQAYLVGNMMFRDWEDGLKNSDVKKKP